MPACLRLPQNVDEERFLGVALEMLQNGSWFVPHRAGEIYADKPPLFMWGTAFFIWLTGSPNIALYLPGLLSAGATTAVLYDLGSRLWNRRIGRYAALLFLATYQTYSILRTGQIDSFLCLWIALGFYGLVRHLLLGPAWGWFYFSCAAMGLGIITKGVGFVPALMLIPYAYAARKGWSGVVAMPGQIGRWALGLLALLLACCVWLVPMVISVVRDGGPEGFAYVQEILLHQTANRYASAWDHREPFWYFFVKVIPQYWLPLVLVLPWLIPAWRRQLSKRDGRVLVLLGWVLLVLLFFSLSSGKRKIYIFPALPGLVLVAAPLLPWLLKRWFHDRVRAGRLVPAVVVVWLSLWFARGFIEPVIEGENPHKSLMEQAASVTQEPTWYWSTGARATGCMHANPSCISVLPSRRQSNSQPVGYENIPAPLLWSRVNNWPIASCRKKPGRWVRPPELTGSSSMPMPTTACVNRNRS